MFISPVTTFNFRPRWGAKKLMPTKKEKDLNDYYLKFYGLPFEGSTSAGKPLRKLSNITCPYTGIKMIPGRAIAGFRKKLYATETAKEVVDVLSGYSQFMQHTEKSVFAIFKDFVALNPKDDLANCMKMLYYNCLTKLKLEEFLVLDDVDMISRKLSHDTALKVRAKTTKCREIILENNQQHTFKRKIFLASLSEIQPKYNEKDIMERIKDKALFLPTSGSSKNAFIVKYANRSQHEAAERIFLASTATIEHVTPASEGGLNTMGNFMLASANGNRYRENMPLYKYINRFPKIPQYCQTYINEIIDAIHNGKLNGNETYPYLIKKKLADESCGKLMLSLSKYKYTEEEAIKAVIDYYETPKWVNKKELKKGEY